MKKLISILLCTFLLILAVGCADKKPQKSDTKKIVAIASIYPVYEFTKAVAGNRAEVQLLLPPSAEAHDWEPSANEIKNIETADIFLYNGGGLEAWAERLAQNIKDITFVNTGEGLFVQREGKNTLDPHIWLDPVLAQAQVEKIKEGLCRVDPEGQAFYEQNAKSYIVKLKDLDKEYTRLSAQSKGYAFIPMHAAFGYMAKRYGWEQVALLGLAPHAEPNPAQMANIIKITQEKNVKYIFVEPHVDSKVMQEIAKETNTKLLFLDTLEGPSKRSGDDYLTRMHANLGNLFTAFGVKQ